MDKQVIINATIRNIAKLMKGIDENTTIKEHLIIQLAIKDGKKIVIELLNEQGGSASNMGR